MSSATEIPLASAFEKLGEAFYSRIRLSPLEDAKIIHLNNQLGRDIGQPWIEEGTDQLTSIFNGETRLGGAEPLASLYAGHQFGVWVSQLGDGRAALLGQVEDAEGQLWEIQSKGGGPTPYSRHADGRAVLRSSIREYLCSEAMHGLGIPTTRSLALLDSSTRVLRESLETGAILIRVSQSHLRFGHFEVFASRDQPAEVRQLADYLIQNYLPQLSGSENPYLALYAEVIERTARTLAQWQAVGFCHGVMNTDNMSMLGLTIDYGPFGFLEAYDPNHICNHSDYQGRYAYSNQPLVAHWNLACLGKALLSLVDVASAQSALEKFPGLYEGYYQEIMAQKLGVRPGHAEFSELLTGWLQLLGDAGADYSLSFSRLTDLAMRASGANELQAQFSGHTQWQRWQDAYNKARKLADAESDQFLSRMRQSNPRYILRNSFAQKAILDAQAGNYQEIDRLHHLLKRPFQRQSGAEAYEYPAADAEHLPVSCSS